MRWEGPHVVGTGPDTGPDRAPSNLLDWFLASRDRRPGAPALRVAGRTWSYAELDSLARDLAQRLTAGGPVRRVGLLCHRDAGGLAGYLAALHAGAAVVPLDPGNPVDRNRDVARRARIDAVVADPAEPAHCDALLLALAGTGQRIPVVRPLTTEPRPPARAGGDREGTPAGRSPRAPGRGSVPEGDDPAYILFTPGPTGQPRGVPITHRNVCAYVAAMLPAYDVGPGDTFSQIHGLTFGLSVFELWLAWASGACVMPLSRSRAVRAAGRVRELGITVWTATPGLAELLLDPGILPGGGLAGLRYTVLCGGQLTQRTAEAWHRAAPGSVLDNLYGPAELTVSCTMHRWDPHDRADPGDTVPIGTPNPGTDLLLLDGELCFGGPQTFPGYLDPRQDEGRFVVREGRRWYRTGDRGGTDDRGRLVRRGRIDTPAKARGHRVELPEPSRGAPHPRRQDRHGAAPAGRRPSPARTGPPDGPCAAQASGSGSTSSSHAG